MTNRSRYLTINDVADVFDVHPATARRWVHTGEMRAVRIGKCFYVEPAEVERLRAEGGAPAVPPTPPATAPRDAWAEYIERVVSAAPPLSPDQAARIATLLGTARDTELATSA
ncbi:helix-turn-helix domain-containing protein [Nocardia brasiliensis]|uniref:helix-turn-helix domain-containing protein n=1 Tax=Nocardia brasiliensis TaxID=37326 RepID=UPI0004A72D13|nr:helix-turn-helix domain-containing protein [Nocardia brasiliensis]